MSHQCWIECPKADAQTVKARLGQKLCRVHKIRKAEKEGFLLIPTTKHLDEAEEAQLAADGSSFDEWKASTLSRLGLRLTSPELPAITSGLLASLSLRRIATTPLLQTNQGPIEDAVSSWLGSIPNTCLPKYSFEELLKDIPKRWSLYYPMVLLPSGSFQSSRWKPFLDNLKRKDRALWYKLWEDILQGISKLEGKGSLTHLAVNAGIPLESDTKFPKKIDSIHSPEEMKKALIDRQNFLRSPSGMIMLYGDFGPSIGDIEDDREPEPTSKDFNDAFWVTTTQNGIHQTWAPRYTMFSRGNIKEKSRLINFHHFDNSNTLKPEVDSRRTAVPKFRLENSMAVDLYAGIGYFVFSYLKMGIGRVLCWEINPWSIEGLRRGAQMNGWSIKVINEEELRGLRCYSIWDTLSECTEKIVVFPANNSDAHFWIPTILEKELWKGKDRIIHVNCGLLPTSRDSWYNASYLATWGNQEAWCHLHENVALGEIEAKKVEIEKYMKAWILGPNSNWTVDVEHVELVKTFAPGVWHCVFDVYFRNGKAKSVED